MLRCPHRASAGLLAALAVSPCVFLASCKQDEPRITSQTPMPPVAAKYFDEVVRIADSHVERCKALYDPETGCKTYLTKPGDAGPAPDVPIESPLLSAAPELIALQVTCSWAAPPPYSPTPAPSVIPPGDPPLGVYCMFQPKGEVPVPYGPNCHAGKPYSPELDYDLHRPSEGVLVPYEKTCQRPWVKIAVNRSLGRSGALIQVRAVFTGS